MRALAAFAEEQGGVGAGRTPNKGVTQDTDNKYTMGERFRSHNSRRESGVESRELASVKLQEAGGADAEDGSGYAGAEVATFTSERRPGSKCSPQNKEIRGGAAVATAPSALPRRVQSNKRIPITDS